MSIPADRILIQFAIGFDFLQALHDAGNTTAMTLTPIGELLGQDWQGNYSSG
jgi:hypothetical protein